MNILKMFHYYKYYQLKMSFTTIIWLLCIILQYLSQNCVAQIDTGISRDGFELRVEGFPGKKSMNESCSVLNALEEELQKENPSPEEQTKLNGEMCKQESFLECIPNPPNGKTGKCKCSNAVGRDKAVFDAKTGVCRIPAELGIESYCGDVSIRVAFSKNRIVNATCTENAACQTHRLHVGRRCYCLKGFNATEGRCSTSTNLKSIEPTTFLIIIIFTQALVSYLINDDYNNKVYK